jgi:hypothetical protein
MDKTVYGDYLDHGSKHQDPDKKCYEVRVNVYQEV